MNTVHEDGTQQDSLLKQNYSKLFAFQSFVVGDGCPYTCLPCKGLWGTKNIDPQYIQFETLCVISVSESTITVKLPIRMLDTNPIPPVARCKATCHICWQCFFRAGSAPFHDPAQLKRAVIQGGTMLEQPPETNAGTLVSIEMIRNEKINPLPCEENSNRREQVEAITMVV